MSSMMQNCSPSYIAPKPNQADSSLPACGPGKAAEHSQASASDRKFMSLLDDTTQHLSRSNRLASLQSSLRCWGVPSPHGRARVRIGAQRTRQCTSYARSRVSSTSTSSISYVLLPSSATLVSLTTARYRASNTSVLATATASRSSRHSTSGTDGALYLQNKRPRAHMRHPSRRRLTALSSSPRKRARRTGRESERE